MLESIFPDELVRDSDTRFHIRVALDTPCETKHAVVLHVKYPETYPDVPPELSVEAEFDDSGVAKAADSEDDDSGQEGPRLADLGEYIRFESNDIQRLERQLRVEAEEQTGYPSVFALVTQLNEEAESHFAAKLALSQKEYEARLAAQEMEEQKKFHGTKVTKELWAAWREKLRKELRVDERKAEAYAEMHGGRMTGREIFEKGLAGDDEMEELSGETGLLAVED